MVRKWSYIKTFSTFFLQNTPITPKFDFKIFRKNTRFKNINQSHTLFIRKTAAIKHRRVGWKPYFLISYPWAKHAVKQKKLVVFLQTLVLFNFTTNYTHANMLSNVSSELSAIGTGIYPIHFFLNTNNIFFKTISQVNILSHVDKTYKCRSVMTKKLLPTVQFNNLSVTKKLVNLGLGFTSLISSKHRFIIQDNLHQKYNSLMSSNTDLQLKLLLVKVSSMRSLHIYTTLHLLYK